MIPLTKCMDYEADLSRLVDELLTVDALFKSESEQAPQRRWEYALALRAARTWGLQSQGRQAIDVGGGGSPLVHMLSRDGYLTVVIDPEANMPLDKAVRTGLRGNLVTCISVVEHVKDFLPFLADLALMVRPGGCLFMTMDIWDPPTEEAPDTAHFSHMRERIFTPKTWQMTAENFASKGFQYLGTQDWAYHGDHLYGSYSFSSIALVKDA